MRIEYYQPGEFLRPTERPIAGAGGSSFGRIARRRPAPTAAATAPLSIQLHAAARARNSRVIGDLVATAVRAIAACVRSLAAGQRQREARAALNARRAPAASALRDLATRRTEVHSVAPGSVRDGDNDRSRAARAQAHPRLN
jgi:hypothetical protein